MDNKFHLIEGQSCPQCGGKMYSNNDQKMYCFNRDCPDKFIALDIDYKSA